MLFSFGVERVRNPAPWTPLPSSRTRIRPGPHDLSLRCKLRIGRAKPPPLTGPGFTQNGSSRAPEVANTPVVARLGEFRLTRETRKRIAVEAIAQFACVALIGLHPPTALNPVPGRDDIVGPPSP